MTRHRRSRPPWRIPLLLLAVVGGCARNPEPSLVPTPTVEMDAQTMQEFFEEIQEYVRLRQKVADAVAPLGAAGTAVDVSTRQKLMTDAIRRYRKGAKQGEIFKKKVEGAFRRILHREFTGPNGPALIQGVRAGNPRLEGVPKPSNPTQEVKKSVELAVNGYYSDEAPFSSVPPDLLLKLPQLPEQVRYRFVGRALILRDTEANIILDFITDVVPDPSIPR
jgi:hypothetical protein